MKKTKKIISLVLVIATLLTANITNVFAANVCSTIGGAAGYSKTFKVTTNNNWLSSKKLVLTQTAKGTAKGKTWSGCKTKYYKIWGHYNVYITDSKGKTQVKSWTDKNFTISGLKKNSKYTIKVVPYSNGSISATWAGFTNGGFYGWKYTPCWIVKKTSGISLCG